MPHLKRILIASCFLSLISVNAFANNQQDNFEELAIKSFGQGQYEQSLSYFNKALELGPASPKLHYNLGSVHYKLGNYKTAQEHFLKLTQSNKFSPLAYYNLGLISHKNNDDASAIKHFKTSKKLSQNKRLKRLCSKQISTIRKSTKSAWRGLISAGYGYDSNITSAPADVATNESGSFMRATGLVNYIITGKTSEGLVANATFFANDYIDTSFNDDKSLSLGLSLRDRRGTWKLAYEAGVKQSTYGDVDYQRTYQATLKAKTMLNSNELRFRYRYEDINSLSTRFDYLEGSRQRMRAEYRIKWPADRLRLQYEIELNDRTNTATSNYSPTRHKIAVKYDSKINSSNAVGGEVEYRTSDYETLATQDRSDDRYSAAVKYTYSFYNHWRLKARVKHKSNDSNEPGDVFDYDRTITTIDLSRTF